MQGLNIALDPQHHVPMSLALGNLLEQVLDQMASRSPFEPQPFWVSLILCPHCPRLSSSLLHRAHVCITVAKAALPLDRSPCCVMPSCLSDPECQS